MSWAVKCPGCQQEVELSPQEPLLGQHACPHCQVVFCLEVRLVEQPAAEDESGSTAQEGEPSAVQQADALQVASLEHAAQQQEPPAEAPPDEPSQEQSAQDQPEDVAASLEAIARAMDAQATEGEPLGGESPPCTELAEPDAEQTAQQSWQALDQQETPSSPPEEEEAQERPALSLEDQRPEAAEEEQEEFWDTLAQEAEAAEESLTEKAQALSQPQGPGLLVHLLGIVISGFLGLAIGYYLLNFFGGPRFNFLNIPLPGVPHTQGESVPEEGFYRIPEPRFPLPPPG